MTQKPDVGPAYPITAGQQVYAQGMSLRDYFAGQAPEPPEAWMHRQREVDRARNPHNEPHKPQPRSDFQLTAEWKYAHADAMIAARGKNT